MKRSIHAALLFAILCSGGALAADADLSRPLMLVAKPELRDDVYGRTVIVVAPLGGDVHVGFIVNRSTEATLGKLFPEDGPSQKVADPVYLGGPHAPQAIFALVNAPQPPAGKTLQVIPGLFAAFESELVDDIIRSDAARAKFVAGLVAWRPGELDGEIDKGAWYVLEPDAALAMRKPEGLWEELVQRAQAKDKAI
jgi:putative transcriptional regulator